MFPVLVQQSMNSQPSYLLPHLHLIDGRVETTPLLKAPICKEERGRHMAIDLSITDEILLGRY